jgi:hypothetical protein
VVEILLEDSLAVGPVSLGRQDVLVPKVVRLVADRENRPPRAAVCEGEESPVPELSFPGLRGRPAEIFAHLFDKIVKLQAVDAGWDWECCHLFAVTLNPNRSMRTTNFTISKTYLTWLRDSLVDPEASDILER